jgi:putative ABC transport system permease protein
VAKARGSQAVQASAQTQRRPHPPNPRSRAAARRFYLIYLRRELRRRVRQHILIALGLAVGVGLVVTVTAITAGVKNAQAAVLHSLYGIGTSVTVTTPARPGGPHGSASGNGGILLPGGLGLLKSSSVTAISRLPGVSHAAGGLMLTELAQAGGASPAAITIDGTDPARPSLGPFATGTITAGRGFPAGDTTASDAIIDSRYAAASKITIGSAITVAGTAFRVTGIIAQPQGGSQAQIYIPLARAQALAPYQTLHNLTGWVNIIYIATSSAADVGTVQAEITRLLPAATITSSASLASTVSGSLASAATLIGDLGRWVAVTGAIAACAIASLLTMTTVARRVREIGTLKALGWRTRRIVAQVMIESAVTGVSGVLAGIALGAVGIAAVDAVGPELTASAPGQGGSATAPGIGVHLAAHFSITAIILAITVSAGGALIAGSLGAWRATRLQPADAFTQVT